MYSPVYIHGIGLITPLGRSLPQTFAAIARGTAVMDRGRVPEAFLEPARGHIAGLRLPSHALPGTLDHSISLGLAALLDANTNAGWSPQVFADEDTSLFIATSKGPAISWLAALSQIHQPDSPEKKRENQDGNLPDSDLAWHVMMGAGALGAAARVVFNFSGPVHTTVAACAGSLIALHRAVESLRRGTCRTAIVLAADSSGHPFFESCYQHLGVLAPMHPDGHRRCHPFSPQSGGFVVSQAAAAFCLSLEPPMKSTLPHISIQSTWIGAEGHHLVAADPLGIRLGEGLRAMNSAGDGPVNFVHAHAAGTRHDAVELRAIQGSCGNIPVFSHKAWLGHALGAAGLVGLALSTACHQNQHTLTGEILPTASASITIAQGFGGHIGLCRLATQATF